MEEITSNVSNIENSLHSLRRQLQILETSAKRSISSEVDGIRPSLKNGDSRVEYVAAQVRSFLSQIECPDDISTSVDMKPQMLWLSDNLQIIASDLDAATAKADSSIESTMNYTYKVMDIRQQVCYSRQQLIEYHNEAAGLEEQAKESLSWSERMLKRIQLQIDSIEDQIGEKSIKVESKRQRKTQLETNLENARQQVTRSERKRKHRKEDAIVGVVCCCHVSSCLRQFTNSKESLGIVGILAAPFTAGTSLALTVGGGGLAGYIASLLSIYSRYGEQTADLAQIQSHANG